MLNGDRRALARILSGVENDYDQAGAVQSALYRHTGRAWVVGVTGAPGTGKSSLVNSLAKAYRARGETVGILAVDPTSPFTGGAILGDRIRMGELAGDKGVFIRSMATRGSLGGLARATRDAIRVMDAAGFDWILVETVGAGQSEVDIVRAAYTTLVIEAPGLGDEVQAIKAGILEIADVLVVNKADRPGVENTVRSLKTMLEIGHPVSRTIRHHGQRVTLEPLTVFNHDSMWIPPIVKTIATEGQGTDELVSAIDSHRAYLNSDGRREILERQHIQLELTERLRDELLNRFLRTVPDEFISELANRIQTRNLDLRTAVETMLAFKPETVAK
jgi:LAO/AO transport system kinase